MRGFSESNLKDPFVQPSALVLVDYDNVFRGSVGESELRHELNRLVGLAVDESSDEIQIVVRLYGGWTAGGALSRRGSEVARTASMADPFPMIIRKRVIRGSVELARSLISDPSVIFDDTYRRRTSPPRLRLSGSPPMGCAEDDTCPAKILMSFTKGPGRTCPSAVCSVSSASAFVVHEQKMVDTMLTCDLMQGAQDAEVVAIFIVSDDTDFIPPLVASAKLCRGEISLLAPNGTISGPTQALLRSKGVRVIQPGGKDGTI